jgi:predicted MFS family arabinose efflux permease
MQPFRRVLAAEVVSNFGSMLSRLVIPWIATLSLAATPLQMGLLAVADVIAGAIGALLLGALVDRQPARAVMVAADLIRAALIALLALFVWRGWVSMLLLMLVAAASGLATMAFELARSAWIAQNTARAGLASRNAQLSAAGNITEAASFGIGGWIYQALGGALSLAVDALSYLVSALFLIKIAKDSAHPRATSPWLDPNALMQQTRSGLATLFADPTLRGLACVHIVVVLGMSLAGTSYMIYVARDLALDPGLLGMIFAVGGVGSAIGAACAPRIGRIVGSGSAIVYGLAFAAIGAVLIPLATLPVTFAIVLLVGHQLVGDAGYVVHDIHDRTLRQSIAPVDQLARVDSGIRMLGQLATLVGALGGGLLASGVGARSALFLSAGLLMVAAFIAQIVVARAPRANLAESPPQ